MEKSELKLIAKIEAILFYVAEPVEESFLAKTLGVKKENISEALSELSVSLNDRGMRLVTHNNEVSFVTAPEFAPIIEKIIKEERERDLGRAGIETLAIIAYKGPVSKKDIEYIRGVNSQYALRSLLLRGLVEKRVGSIDERVVMYDVTIDALRHLGLGSVTELPEYSELKSQLEVIEEKELATDDEMKEEHGQK